MRKQRQQAEHSHDLELQLLRLVRHSLRQRVQMQIEIADPEDGGNQYDADNDHQDIGVAGRGDEGRQMVRRAGMQ
jgi:hypothetical protein